MNLPIGTLSVGQLFQHGMKLWLSRLPVLFLIHLILLLPVFMVLVFLFIASGPVNTFLVVGVLLLVWLVFTALTQAAALFVVAQASIDRSAGMNDSLLYAVARLPSLLTAAFLMAVIVIAPLMLLGLPGAMMMADGGVLAYVVLILGLAVGLAAAAFLLGWFVLAAPATLVDGTGAFQALSRSKALTDGLLPQALTVIGLLTVVYLLPFVAAWLARLVLPYDGDGFSAYLNLILIVLLAYVLVVLASSLIAVVWALFYLDTRARKEPIDLAVLAQQQQEMVQ